MDGRLLLGGFLGVARWLIYGCNLVGGRFLGT